MTQGAQDSSEGGGRGELVWDKLGKGSLVEPRTDFGGVKTTEERIRG